MELKPKDLITEILEKFYAEFNIKFKYNKNGELDLSRYFNFRLKLIEAKPRKVHIAKESIEIIFLSEHKIDILNLLEKIKKGIDINPHQSKQSFNVDYHDMLFNDWGIHHLHLNHNKKRPTDYFNIRTGPLLFVKFDKENAYVIGLKKHSDKNLWSDKDIIRLIRNNWNYLLEPFEVGNGNWFPNFDDEEIGIVRNKGYTFSINVDDKSYLMIGDGYSSSGDNSTAMNLANEVLRWIGKNLELFENDKDEFKKRLIKEMRL